MTVKAKGYRVYPYQNGLLIGTEADIVLVNENSEPVDSSILFKSSLPYETENVGGSIDSEDDKGINCFKPKNGMVRLYTRCSYCRAFSIDNIWWTLKHLVVELKKRAFISSVPCFLAEDFTPPKNDGMSYVAGGSLVAHIGSRSVYDSDTFESLLVITTKQDTDIHKKHLDNVRLIVGLMSTIMDRRESAEYRRIQYAPGSNNEFTVTPSKCVYNTPTNFWIFHPALAHLMTGLLRMAYFVTLNGLEPEIWEGFEPGDIHNAIKRSDYATAEEIWHMMKNRLADSGYQASENPVWDHRKVLIDFILKSGYTVFGNGIYKNWHMANRMDNYEGHFNILPSWDENATDILEDTKHPSNKQFEEFRESYARREKERTA